MRKLLIDGLLACGWKEVPCRSTKYVAFQREGDSKTMLVGKSGALRYVSNGKPISSSFSLTGGRLGKAYVAVGKIAAKLTSEQQARKYCTHVYKTGA